MKYGEVSRDEYHTGIDALKWVLIEARSKVINLDIQLRYAQNDVNKIVNDINKILEAST